MFELWVVAGSVVEAQDKVEVLKAASSLALADLGWIRFVSTSSVIGVGQENLSSDQQLTAEHRIEANPSAILG
jgi:hypothetical protein